MGIVDPVTFTCAIFHVSVHTHLHRRGADPGDLALNDYQIILIGTVQEGQIIHGRGGNIAHGMALGYNAGYLIDPLHQNATEKTVGTV
jgi:hypothetical protein